MLHMQRLGSMECDQRKPKVKGQGHDNPSPMLTPKNLSFQQQTIDHVWSQGAPFTNMD